MKTKVYTVYDSKAESYLQPFFAQSNGAALRSFIEAINTAGHQFNKYAADFTLFEIGEYDHSTGKISNNHTTINLGCGLSFLETKPQQLNLMEQAQ